MCGLKKDETDYKSRITIDDGRIMIMIIIITITIITIIIYSIMHNTNLR